MPKKTAAQPSHADNLPDVPTPEEYKAALLACRPAMKGKKYLEMLRANYRAPGHTVTAEELADAVDLPSYSAANLQYGNYAKELNKVLERTTKYHVALLVSFNANGEPPGENELVSWTMLPPLATALEELGWVKPG
jgi:hypothetical protein